jgi:hypothetical protein
MYKTKSSGNTYTVLYKVHTRIGTKIKTIIKEKHVTENTKGSSDVNKCPRNAKKKF